MAAFATIPAGASLRPEKFELKVSEQDLKDFKDLVRLSKLAPETYENTRTDGRYGLTHEWMSQTKAYWETQYDWRQREIYINSFPNFVVDVEDQDGTFRIHFAALFSKRKDAIPLLFLHGWPGSHLEFLKMLDIYRKRYSEDELPYHIIAPSLPGYSLSSGPPLDKDWLIDDMGRVLNSLMVGLGFGSGYIAQGGDIGSFECRVLAALHDECKAIHLNLAMDWVAPEGVDEKDINDAERTGLKRLFEFLTTGSAYSKEHGTRPATIGFVLSASPLSLLAWIGEKFIEWTDTTPTTEDILDSVTLYWFTQSFPRCIYPYRELGRSAHITHGDPKYYCKKPMGFSWFPQELGPVPRAWVEKTGNLVFHRQHTEGGHFAAMEKPELLAQDMDDFVKQIWPVK
ncbi:hypothetical protein B0A52_02984 [Exophiala mesophila]|uniref:Epoxide hydrolase N-terminal domain-containing protein n=1 Tax=Exophiala mesophila TaxID=212818 RepID=A0A438NC42_EXOME|nr:hypothetical protein B0A52_02984 [Exophiala mesophila]